MQENGGRGGDRDSLGEAVSDEEGRASVRVFGRRRRRTKKEGPASESLGGGGVGRGRKGHRRDLRESQRARGGGGIGQGATVLREGRRRHGWGKPKGNWNIMRKGTMDRKKTKGICICI